MSKSITKIVKATLGLTMAIGMGVSAAVSNKAATRLDADAGEEFQLVTDASTLAVNDKVVIGSGINGSIYLLSTTQNNNNRAATGTFTVSNTKVVTLTDAAQVLTLGKTNSHWTFYTGSSGYLYAASSSKNYLRTQTTNNANGEWTVSIAANGNATVTAQGSNTRNILKYNANDGDPIFSCYSTSGTVALYKKVSNNTVSSVTASIKPGTYYSGSSLLASDFNVTVSWTGGKADTNPTSGFTWTVGGVENGTLATGSNSVIVTYQSVSSGSFNVTAIADTRWDTEFSNTMVADIVLPNSGDTAEKYYVVARITEISNTQYGNGTAEDEDGTEFAVYGMYNFNGQVRYDSMKAEQKPSVNDIAVLFGVFTKYNDAPEIKNAWVVQLNGTVFEAPALTGISLNKSTLDLEKNTQFTLKASPNPADAVLGDVSWSSSNESIATVNSSGVVTGVKTGNVTITATAGGFSANCAISVVLKNEIDLTTDHTSSISDELVAWGDENIGMVLSKGGSDQNANNYLGGISDRSSTRFYSKQNLVLGLNPTAYKLLRIIFTATTEGYASTFAGSTFENATASASGTTVTVNVTKGDRNVVVRVAGTCGFSKVQFIYDNASFEQQIEHGVKTNSSLTYNYVKNGENDFTFSNVKIKFGGYVTKSLWDGLNAESTIQGYGVMISTADTDPTGYIGDENFKDEYALALSIAEGDVDDAIDLLCDNKKIFNFSKSGTPYLHEAANEVDYTEDTYAWNLVQGINTDHLTRTYVAIAYIRTNAGLVFLKEERISVQEIAERMIGTGNYDEDPLFESLSYLSNL